MITPEMPTEHFLQCSSIMKKSLAGPIICKFKRQYRLLARKLTWAQSAENFELSLRAKNKNVYSQK